jgi:hypothetical protein
MSMAADHTSAATLARMFEQFDEPARRALFFSRYEASRAGGDVIDSEHILLGILWNTTSPPPPAAQH